MKCIKVTRSLRGVGCEVSDCIPIRNKEISDKKITLIFVWQTEMSDRRDTFAAVAKRR